MESENINKESGNKYEFSILHILNISFDQVGYYKCHVAMKRNETYMDMEVRSILLNVTSPAQIVQISPRIYKKIHEKVELFCVVKGYPIESIKWLKDNDSLPKELDVLTINATHKNTSLKLEVTKKDNGTYTCIVNTSISRANGSTEILVLDKPQIALDIVKPIGINKIFLNWTVNDGNSPNDLKYIIQYKSEDEKEWVYYQAKINSSSRSLVLNVKNNTLTSGKNSSMYTVRIMAENSQGSSQYSTSSLVRMLDEEPIFIPEVTAPGATTNSINIKWTSPPNKFKDHIHYYNLILRAYNSSQKFEAIQPANKDYLYMFSDLNPATTYNIQVAACSDYSRECGPWSKIVNGTTMDGMADPPSNASVECRFDNISYTNFVYVSWQPPSHPHGTIVSYNVSIKNEIVDAPNVTSHSKDKSK